jgi:ubiquinone/menaquinone biosynthesis C-methylase UbiE
MAPKTSKELAFLHDLFVSADWGERFAELIDEHLVLPKKGRALYVAAGTGGHVIALQERANKDLRFLAVDESEDNLELAREKAKAAEKDPVEFSKAKVDRLGLDDDQFSLVIGDGSLVHSERIPAMIDELARVSAPGGTVALVLPSFSSFGEFFSVYWEALHNLGLIDHEGDVESLISVLPSVSKLEEISERAGLEEVKAETKIEEFDYESAEAFFSAPLIVDFLQPIWFETLPPASHQPVIDEILRIINEESRGLAFALTVKATILTGKKAPSR